MLIISCRNELQRQKLQISGKERIMAMATLLSQAEKFELTEYERPKNLRALHVPFTGSPLKHPYDATKIILVVDPYGGISSYYEFNLEDISFIEKTAHIVNIDGETITMVRIWVKKKSVGIRSTLFVVDEIRK